MQTFEIIIGVFNMIGNLAVAGALLISFVALGFSIGAFWMQRKSSYANLFHNITSNINSLLKDELKHIDEEDKEKDTYERWLDTLLMALEYYTFYANRKFISKEMSEFYMPIIEHYCKKAEEFPGLIQEIDDYKDQLVYCELRKYYQKYIRKTCPL